MENIVYDVAIIGGGPGGIMTAGRIAELGKKDNLRVILLEKNPTLGVKLLITGGGRCNITNAELDVRTFLSKYNNKYQQADKFLFSCFSQFSVKDTLDFFNKRGMETKVEAGNRVFPVSDKAESVWNVLIEYIKEGNVEIRTNANVIGFETGNENKNEQFKKISAVKIKNKAGKIEIIKAKKFVLATGGVSRPETGSTGDGFKWLSDLGHKIIPPDNALVPVMLDMKGKNAWLTKLSGVTLQDIKLTTFQNNQKQETQIGRLLFTHFGISGPTVLNMSRDISELLKYGEVEIHLDLLPSFDHGMLNSRLQELFKIDNKKLIKNSLNSLIPSSLVPAILELSNIKSETQNSNITREERMKLIETIKNIPMYVTGLLGSEKAIVSSGGVDLSEVDFRTMQSRIIPNLYLVGDILNIDRPSGGYSLQLCWTTGFVAGSATAT